MGMKSQTCIGKMSGKPVTEYESKKEAQEGADHARSKFGRKLLPYQCDTCGSWHLAPEGRQTPSQKCPVCTGSDGKPKETYRNEDEAQRRAELEAPKLDWAKRPMDEIAPPSLPIRP